MKKQIILATVLACMVAGIVATPYAQTETLVGAHSVHHVSRSIGILAEIEKVWVPPEWGWVWVDSSSWGVRGVVKCLIWKVVRKGYWETVVAWPPHW